MPYVVLLAGILLGLYGLYRFMRNANDRQIKALLLTLGIPALLIALFYIVITGKAAFILALLPALLPVVLASRRKPHTGVTPDGEEPPPAMHTPAPLSRQEALDVLGLPEGASPEEIRAAHRKLIKKLHPDQQGSSWLAIKINQARDKLLEEKG